MFIVGSYLYALICELAQIVHCIQTEHNVKFLKNGRMEIFAESGKMKWVKSKTQSRDCIWLPVALLKNANNVISQFLLYIIFKKKIC